MCVFADVVANLRIFGCGYHYNAGQMYGLETLLLNLRKLSIRYDGDFKNIAKINVALCTKQNAK